MARRKTIKVGDLFAGAGLFSQAFNEAGGNLKFAIELDPLAASSYARNVGTEIKTGSVVSQKVFPACDVIVAGPPCQGFSTLGRRDPKDVRNSLCLVVPQWAERCRAQVVVVENVPPFLASPSWKLMRDAFEARQYEVATWTLDAVDFGVPQRRRRSFTIASKIGLPEPPKPVQATTIAHVFKRLRRNDPMHVWPEGSDLMKHRLALLPENGDRRDLLLASPELCPPSWWKIGCQATDVWGRMKLNAPANTLRCDFQNPSKGRYVHPTESRVISLREGARLQQIPDSWVLNGHRTAITRQIGNGVPLGLGRAIAQQVMNLF
ncbi:hypothetical protein C7S18_08645 [Ahniella affigens]|uniref:DNA (cytosine-5-)-methyltransferase n=1 Tax=Ahniella affigens TaxID=2021234 RepID=A0A2P1PQY2_9GAMM|nr:DNA cytosine methyltransferase [Ahniella affigens]AVP97257.1 hypothetical protein C7S18_08645 [Ahniella affigens]